MSAAHFTLAEARRKYDIATEKYWEMRRAGDIREVDQSDPDEGDDYAAGARWKAVTPAARMVLGIWQKCKAELDHAAKVVAAEGGSAAARPIPPDPRLPPEREHEEEAAWR